VLVEKSPFVVRCDDFRAIRAFDDIILPCSNHTLLGKSGFHHMPPPLRWGGTRYTLSVTHDGETICQLLVRVTWVKHPVELEWFLGFLSEKYYELWAYLKSVEGKSVELSFVPVQTEQTDTIPVSVRPGPEHQRSAQTTVDPWRH
jgi:hypothetical protein